MFEYPPGATPLDPDESEGLIPNHITQQAQLNEWEQANILEAEQWVGQQKFRLDTIIDTRFVKRLHYLMFKKTWKWAGKFRQSNKNIGVDWLSIEENLRLLFDDVDYQLTNNSYLIDELAARFHHRLVAIHPFPNGNGRYARLMTDILLLSQGEERFSWGNKMLTISSPARDRYIAALRLADNNDYQQLIEFVRQ